MKELSPLQRAFVTIKEMRSKLDALESSAREPIAIVGMGCRFPGGANDPESFWQILRDGVDTIGEVPRDRWNVDDYYDPDPQAVGKTKTRQGGFLDGKVSEFDAEFFGLHPREVASMDPQQRLLLEVSWEALENAGIPPEKLTGSKSGVFVGISVNEYLELALSNIDVYTATGNVSSVAAGRLAHKFGFQGPAIAIDTACSSSLVAVHLASASLRSGECDLALVGGVVLMLSPASIVAMSKLGALSADGRCKTFDATADGYGRSEGCGIAVLKRLRDAVADGDNILAVVRGSAVNQDGPSSGLTVPNGRAQQAVIRAALQNAKVEPEDISYIEAHGTGTSLGDPIEVRALNAVFANRPPEAPPLTVGSVKTNIGHLEPTAGIAGLMKVVLAMQHGEIPPHLHLTNLNPHIAETGVSFTIPTKLTPWLPGKDGKLLAGVSSFGFSGTNSHVILESPPPREKPGEEEKPGFSPSREKPGFSKKPGFWEEEQPYLLTLSAKSETALQELARCYAGYLKTHPEVELGDICFTAYTGRTHFEHRLAVVGSSREEMVEKLLAAGTGETLLAAGTGETLLAAGTGETLLATGTGETLLAAGTGETPVLRVSDLARTYMQGGDIDWKEVDGDCQRRRVQLPTYPFQRQSYWINGAKNPDGTLIPPFSNSSSTRQKTGRRGSETQHPLLHERLHSPLEEIQFESRFSLDKLPLVGGHRMDGMALVNLAIFLEMICVAAREAFGTNDCFVEDLSISQGLIMPETGSRMVHLVLSPPTAGKAAFKIFSAPGEPTGEVSWTLHVSGLVALDRELDNSQKPTVDLAQLQKQYPEEMAGSQLYQKIEKRGVTLGPSCQRLERVWRRDGDAIATIGVRGELDSDHRYCLPMGAIDAWTQVLAACFPEGQSQMYLLSGFDKFSFYGYSGKQLWGKAKIESDRLVENNSQTVRGELWLFDEGGALVAEINGAKLQQVKVESLRRAREASNNASNRAAQPRRESKISKEAVFAIAPSDRPPLLEKYLIEELAVALQSQPSKISSSQPLATLVDSLMAFELRNRIESDLQVRLPVESFLGESNIAELALAVLEKLTLANLTLAQTSTSEEELEEIVL